MERINSNLRIESWADKLSQRHIYVAAIVLSLLLSIISYDLFPIINPDAVLYLRGAAVYEQGGLKAAMALYPWPFYSIVIAMIHHLGFSYLIAGRLLNALLQAWVVYFFIRIIFHFNATPRIGFWALLCILCCGTLNEIRGYLLRDFGYWAFYLTALWAALTFLKVNQKRYLGLFGLSILIAALFRIEGVIIAASAVVLIFFMPNQSLFIRIRNSLLMAWPFWVGALLLVVIGNHHLYGEGRLPEVYHRIVDAKATLLYNKNQSIALMNEALQPRYSFIQASKLYFSMLVGYFIYRIVSSIGLGGSALALYGRLSNALILNSREKILLYGLIIVQLVMLAILLENYLFLVPRYALAFGFLILIWSPFGLEQIYQKTMAMSGRKWRLTIAAVVAGFFMYRLLFSVVYIRPYPLALSDAIHWLQQHVGANDRILVTDGRILYHVKGPIATWNEDLQKLGDTTTCQFPGYRYVAIYLRGNKDPLAQCPNLTLLKPYDQVVGDTVNIYATETK